MAVTTAAGGEKRVRLHFVKGIHHEGVDYGPDYDEQVADVLESEARGYLARGVAILEADAKKAAPASKKAPEK